MRIVAVLITTSTLLMSGCQSLPSYSWPSSQTATHPQTLPKFGGIKAAPSVVNEPVANQLPIEPVIVAPVLTPVKPIPPVVVQPAKQLADGRDMPAVQNLLASAQNSLQQGKPEDAASSLERAQRLAPQSAAVYQKLAEVRLQQNRVVEAEQLARKGVAYAHNNSQQAALWRLVAIAADRQGKGEVAAKAREKVILLEAAGDRG
jgi:tetratricopeptide (TPR) repeat protein